MKLCVDCKYSKETSFLECHHPENTEVSLATGKKKLRWKHCSTVRTDGWLSAILFRQCGKRARWFEPKESEKKPNWEV